MRYMCDCVCCVRICVTTWAIIVTPFLPVSVRVPLSVHVSDRTSRTDAVDTIGSGGNKDSKDPNDNAHRTHTHTHETNRHVRQAGLTTQM